MQFDYDYGGLLIGSPLDFHGMPLASQSGRHSCDISINLAFGDLPRERDPVHVWGGRYGLALERRDAGGWMIRYSDRAAIGCDERGSMLDCTCSDADQAPVLADILTRRVLPRLTSLHGRMPVHAAALARDDGAVLLFGTSGAGKSTLTAALATAGWRIMSDDMSILSGWDDPHVWQTAPGVSLWADSRAALGLPDSRCRPIEGYAGKYWYLPDETGGASRVPIKALVFLGPLADAVTWQRSSGAQAVMTAALQMVRFNPSNTAESAAALDNFKRLATGLPCYNFAYPRDYGALSAATAGIADILDDAQRQALR